MASGYWPCLVLEHAQARLVFRTVTLSRGNAGQYAATEEIFKAAGAVRATSKVDSSLGVLGCMFALL